MTICVFRAIFSRLILFLLLTLSGCGPLVDEIRPRFFWPPPPIEPKIEYINFYFSSDDLQRGVDRRLEYAILGKKTPERLIEQPFSVASNGKGCFYVTDFRGSVQVFDLSQHESRKLDVGRGVMQKILIDSRGEIWVLDAINKVLHHFDGNEKHLGEIILSGVEGASSFAVDRDRSIIYVVDTSQHQLRLYDLAGRFLHTIGKRGVLPGEFNYPGDIDLDGSGNLYILDVLNARIQILSPDGTPLRTFGERGTAGGAFAIPKGVAVSPSGLIYVTDASHHKVVVFNTAGDYLLTIGARYVYSGTEISPGGFNFPAGVDVDANETIWIADLLNGMIHEYQYLTPEYLARRPIREDEIYRPKATDYGMPEDGALLPPPVQIDRVEQ